LVPDSEQASPALLCWDGSEAAAQAIEEAAAILGAHHPAVLLFAHVPTEAARGLLGGLSGPDAPIMGAADAEDVLERGTQAAADAGFEVTPRRVEAQARTSRIIAEMAEETNARLIVMGQRERSAVGTLLLGSVAREVLESHHRPVMLVGPSSAGEYPRAPRT
jgi:nucleotide-binding universal stress UspA family protein